MLVSVEVVWVAGVLHLEGVPLAMEVVPVFDVVDLLEELIDDAV